MQVFSRVGLVGIAAVASGVVGPSGAQPSSSAPQSVVAVSDHRPFAVRDGLGRYLALHFLTRTSSPENTDAVREYVREAPTLAGVRHVFIRPDPHEVVSSWSRTIPGSESFVFSDSEGAFARSLNVPTGLSADDTGAALPALVVFGPEGTELFRRVGKADDDRLSFADFATKFTQLTARPAIKDYNLGAGAPALDGYDPVAYFTQNKAVKGKASLPSAYRGVTYRFASDESRDRFVADPERYLPTYGGWCASAMGAKGTKVEIDPTNFKVKDGRLFLFYKSLFGDALKDWNKHEREWEPAADVNWKTLADEGPSKQSK
ncbi:hypothetical protein PHYC_01385 [Phycisphaerales bacterium]|nr:hypothetical protein PHYC_01385 [Phycisphaerales bacterium]